MASLTMILLLAALLCNYGLGDCLIDVGTEGITNTTTLASNQSVFVFIQSNYTQGTKTPTLNATVQTYSTSVRDQFPSKPLAITSLLTLSEGTTAISETRIDNRLSTPQPVSWQFNTGQQNITNATSVNTSLLVLLQTNYTTSGAYQTVANLTSGTYRDNRTGVIIQ